MSRPRGKARKGEHMVAAAPFRDWLNARYDEIVKQQNPGTNGVPDSNTQSSAINVLAVEIGFAKNATEDAAARRLYRYRRGLTDTARGKNANGSKKRVVLSVEAWPRSVVEDACDSSSPDLFYALYPEFAHERDIVLEPDAFCPFCEEWVTPVDGLCPWCVCAHGHLFREVGITDDGFACLACAKNESAKVQQRYKREWDREQKEAA